MNFPFFYATSIKATLTGSTYPIIMEVMGEDGERYDYVVKVFNQRRIENSQPINKEFYAYALAKAFDLKIPEAAIIYVDNRIIAKLKEQEKYQKQDLQHGLYFGSKYIEGAIPLEFNSFQNFEDSELENIFAFDALIHNIDRRLNNHNLFEYDKTLYLIDHELSLSVNPDCMASLSDDTQWNFLSKGNVKERSQHIFYERLKALHSSNSLEFSEFLLHLRMLNPNRLLRAVAQKLDEAAENIEDFECDTSDVETLIAYLNCIKAHEIQFIHQLTAQLS